MPTQLSLQTDLSHGCKPRDLLNKQSDYYLFVFVISCAIHVLIFFWFLLLLFFSFSDFCSGRTPILEGGDVMIQSKLHVYVVSGHTGLTG